MRFRKALLSDVEFSRYLSAGKPKKGEEAYVSPPWWFFPVLSVIRRIRHTRLYHGAF